MIIPRFELKQDEKTVTITIRAPYCSLKELDVTVEDNLFIFTCKPYYLRLNLPGNLLEDEHMKSSFDVDTGEFTFRCEKRNSGEHFENLEFVTKFLCSKVEVDDGSRKIDVISCNQDELASDIKEDTSSQYGFAMRGGYNFKALSGEFSEILEIDPCVINLKDRQALRQSQEKKDFDCDHYLADFMDNAEINELICLPTPWHKLVKTDIQFSSKELDFLKDLTNIEYNLAPLQIQYSHNGLLDLLYAYCYDGRSTCFEKTCESGWTISKLSATLCWFDGFEHPKETLVCAFRRSLIYPLFRAFNFSQQVLNDLRTLVKLGEQFIIKCLIEIHDVFLSSERYVFNNLFIKDYIVYIMKWDKELWNKTLDEFDKAIITKKDLGLNLLQIEEESTDLNINMENLNLNDTDSDDTSSEDSSYDSSDSSD